MQLEKHADYAAGITTTNDPFLQTQYSNGLRKVAIIIKITTTKITGMAAVTITVNE